MKTILIAVALGTALFACSSETSSDIDQRARRPTPALGFNGVVSSAALGQAQGNPPPGDNAWLEIVATGEEGTFVAGSEALHIHIVPDASSSLAPSSFRELWGGGAVSLEPGSYNIAVRYRPAPSVLGTGKVTALRLSSSEARCLKLTLSLPTGLVRIHANDEKERLGERAEYRILALDEAGRTTDTLLASGNAEGSHRLALGRYRASARVRWTETLSGEWVHEDFVLDSARPVVDVRLRIPAVVGSLTVLPNTGKRDLSEEVSVRVFPQGERPGSPLAEAWGGEEIELPAGRYDVQARFRKGPFVEAKAWAKGVSLSSEHPRARVPLALDVRFGTLAFRVFQSGKRVTEGVVLRIQKPGDESGEALEVAGSGPIALPPGRYDVAVKLVAPTSSEAGVHWDRGVVVGDGQDSVRDIRL